MGVLRTFHKQTRQNSCLLKSLPGLQCDGHAGSQGDNSPSKQMCRADRDRGSRQDQQVCKRKANPWQAQCRKSGKENTSARVKGWQTPADPDCTPAFGKRRKSLNVIECQGDKLKCNEGEQRIQPTLSAAGPPCCGGNCPPPAERGSLISTPYRHRCLTHFPSTGRAGHSCTRTVTYCLSFSN